MYKDVLYKTFSDIIGLYMLIACEMDKRKTNITKVALTDGKVTISAHQPLRHFHLYWMDEKEKVFVDLNNVKEGFLFRGEFIDRKTAKMIALQNGQLESETRSRDLFSEDLWNDGCLYSEHVVDWFGEKDATFKFDVIRWVIQNTLIDNKNKIVTLHRLILSAITMSDDGDDFLRQVGSNFITLLRQEDCYSAIDIKNDLKMFATVF